MTHLNKTRVVFLYDLLTKHNGNDPKNLDVARLESQTIVFHNDEKSAGNLIRDQNSKYKVITLKHKHLIKN